MKKKLVSLMLAATMVVSLAACGSKKTEAPTSTVHKDITAAQYDSIISADAAIYKKNFTMPEFKGMEVTVDKSVLNVSVFGMLMIILTRISLLHRQKQKMLQVALQLTVIASYLITQVSLMVKHSQVEQQQMPHIL